MGEIGRLLNGQHISELTFKCRYCGYVGRIYPMHYCSEINGMRDIENNLMRDTIPLTDEEEKKYNYPNPTFFQKVVKWFKQ